MVAPRIQWSLHSEEVFAAICKIKGYCGKSDKGLIPDRRVGYTAATYMRGVNVVQIPTTLL